MNDAIACSLSRALLSRASTSAITSSRTFQRSRKTVSRISSLDSEVVVDEPVGDARLVGDVGDAARVEALAGEDADRRVEDLAALLGGRLAAAGRRAIRRCHLDRGAVGERRQLAADPRLCVEIEVGDDVALARRAPWPARGPTDRRSATARPSRMPPRCEPIWLAATTNACSSIARARRGPPSGRGRRQRERGRHGRMRGAAHGQRAVELGEAQVVADRSSRLAPPAWSQRRSRRRLLGGRLAVLLPSTTTSNMWILR